jgi:hypothetical protein
MSGNACAGVAGVEYDEAADCGKGGIGAEGYAVGEMGIEFDWTRLPKRVVEGAVTKFPELSMGMLEVAPAIGAEYRDEAGEMDPGCDLSGACIAAGITT